MTPNHHCIRQSRVACPETVTPATASTWDDIKMTTHMPPDCTLTIDLSATAGQPLQTLALPIGSSACGQRDTESVRASGCSVSPPRVSPHHRLACLCMTSRRRNARICRKSRDEAGKPARARVPAVPDRRPGLPAGRRAPRQDSGLRLAAGHRSAVGRRPGGAAGAQARRARHRASSGAGAFYKGACPLAAVR
jgi:hypothetical protein